MAYTRYLPQKTILTWDHWAYWYSGQRISLCHKVGLDYPIKMSDSCCRSNIFSIDCRTREFVSSAPATLWFECQVGRAWTRLTGRRGPRKYRYRLRSLPVHCNRPLLDSHHWCMPSQLELNRLKHISHIVSRTIRKL